MTTLTVKKGDKIPNSLENISEIYFEDGLHITGEIKPLANLIISGLSKNTKIRGYFNTSLLKKKDKLTLTNFIWLCSKNEPPLKFGNYYLNVNNIDIMPYE